MSTKSESPRPVLCELACGGQESRCRHGIAPGVTRPRESNQLQLVLQDQPYARLSLILSNT